MLLVIRPLFPKNTQSFPVAGIRTKNPHPFELLFVGVADGNKILAAKFLALK